MWCESQKGMAKKSMVIVFSFQVLAVKKESSFDDADAAPAAGLGGCLPRPPPPPVDRGGRGGIQKTGHLEYNVQVAFLFKKTSNLFFFSEGEGKAATGGEGCGQGWKVPWVEWKFRDCSHIWESQELIFTCPYLCSVSISDNQVRTLWMCRMYYLDHCKCTYLHTMYLYMVVGGKKTRFWKKKSLRQKFLSSEKVIRTILLFFFFLCTPSFPNAACSGSGTKNGTCYTQAECSSLGGTNAGSCASGFGVCCTCEGLLPVHTTWF